VLSNQARAPVRPCPSSSRTRAAWSATLDWATSAYCGYWIDSRAAGRGIMPTALALITDHAFHAGRLHRVEVNIRPENKASRRVVEKLGFREEGYHPHYMYIDGAWRDHIGYAMTWEDVAREGGLLARWRRVRAS
jgi:ribosomal-protein-alanine N-acetyltransferase